MRKAMITGTTITCQSLMATFLGKKCVLISFFLYILIKRASLMFAQSGFCSARQSSEKRRVGENLCRFLWRRCVDLLIHPYCVTSLAVSQFKNCFVYGFHLLPCSRLDSWNWSERKAEHQEEGIRALIFPTSYWVKSCRLLGTYKNNRFLFF